MFEAVAPELIQHTAQAVASHPVESAGIAGTGAAAFGSAGWTVWQQIKLKKLELEIEYLKKWVDKHHG